MGQYLHVPSIIYHNFAIFDAIDSIVLDLYPDDFTQRHKITYM